VVATAFETVEFRDVIAGLPFRQRVVIVGRYWAGWSEAELADLLQCRPGTIKSLASRAIDRMRMQIEKDSQ
jgi:RNA polymerase sigma factor (sigma-70 family)